MSWLSYLFPQTIAQRSSPYNKNIRINEETGRLKLLVNGSRQSGVYIEKLWGGALKKFAIDANDHVGKILVLGVAGGSVIHILHAFYPKAAIVGVDIDGQMIAIGKKYFGLNKISGLTLMTADAKEFVKKPWHFDLIIIDLSFGGEIPDFVSDNEFLTDIKKSLMPGGRVVINYLRERTYLVKSNHLKTSLQSMFINVSDFPIERNRFFLGQRSP